ncbi:DNA methylase [human gut metagenome]|uniref:DNA methylase n=1 Tax=human gut metagenome TaxID=408170 RepID=K1TME5_9ZZZZ
MMLGSMEYDTRIYGQDSRYTVCVNNDENFNMYETLNKAIGNIKAQMTDFERVADESEQTEEVIPADPDVRNYTYTFLKETLLQGKFRDGKKRSITDCRGANPKP